MSCIMTLAFFRVYNSQDYGLNSFSSISDDRQAIIDKLNRLKEDELRCYDLESVFDVNWFMDDFNYDFLNSKSWQCIIIP